MVKKREGDKASHTFKDKRSKHERESPKSDETTIADMNQLSEGSMVEHEEEIICEGEVEIQMSDEDGGCVDVESTNEHTILYTQSRTPTPTCSNTNRDADEKTENSLQSTLCTTPPPTKADTPTAPVPTSSVNNCANAKRRKGRRNSGTSSDEERWLTAIESGKLEDVDDELKKIKNPKVMTARQRAMYERSTDKEASPGGELLMSLPNGYREKEKPQTAEAIRKAALKSQKRKQLADEKREKDKKKTMERLLKKQDSKQRSTARNKSTKAAQPMITYRDTVRGATLTFPPEHDFPLQSQKATDPPKPQLCAIPGCGNLKVYSCSKTKLPLCSFTCYRKNVQAIKQIMF